MKFTTRILLAGMLLTFGIGCTESKPTQAVPPPPPGKLNAPPAAPPMPKS